MIWGYLGLDVTVMNTYIVKQKGGHFQFFDYTSVSLTCIVFFSCVITHIVSTSLLIAGLTNAISLCADFFPSSTCELPATPSPDHLNLICFSLQKYQTHIFHDSYACKYFPPSPMPFFDS